MSRQLTRRSIIIQALLASALLALPVQAHAAGLAQSETSHALVESGAQEASDNSSFEESPLGAYSDKSANDEPNEENSAASSTTKPEYKYVPVRRY